MACCAEANWSFLASGAALCERQRFPRPNLQNADFSVTRGGGACAWRSVSFAAQSREKQRLVRLGMRMAIPTLVTPYLMWRRGWISDGIPIARSVLASLPLPFLPIALMAGMIGWGDMQEHWVRAALYLTHRELTERW
jgi:hypothetical protein